MSDSHQAAGDNAPSLGSVLVIDISEDAARAHLFDLVEGSPRFVATAWGPAGAEPETLLGELERAAARRLIDAGALISPQRADGDGVDRIFHIIDSDTDVAAAATGDPLLAGASKVDREAAGRTALDVLATRMGHTLLAIDFDLELARSALQASEHLSAAERDYLAIRQAIAGFREQLSLNGGRSSVNVLAIGPSLMDAPIEASVLAIIDGCGLQPSSGMITVATDREGLLLPLGAIAVSDPAYAMAIFEDDFLIPLGSYLAVAMPDGQATTSLAGRMMTSDSDTRDEFDVNLGGLYRIKLERGASAELVLDLPAGARLAADSSDSPVRLHAPETLTGGSLGIVIDTRSYDADMPIEPATLTRWLDDLRSILTPSPNSGRGG